MHEKYNFRPDINLKLNIYMFNTKGVMNRVNLAHENPIIEKMKLGVFASNERGIHLYTKMGFIEEGRKVDEIKNADGEYIDVIEMYKNVKSI